MTHPRIQALMDQFGMSKQEAMFSLAIGLGVISGDTIEPGEPQGEELDKAVLAALAKQDGTEAKPNQKTSKRTRGDHP